MKSNTHLAGNIMTTNTLNPLQARLSTARLTPIKIIASLLVLSYGIFNFSAHYWILLALLVVAILAISDRISRLTASHKTNKSNQQRVINTDGGSFSKLEQSRVARNASPVVLDGGIYNRKH